jgi:signal peptidase II
VKKQLTIVSITIICLLLVDQIIKLWIKSEFVQGEIPTPILGDWFRLHYIENPGMAFGTTFGSKMWHKLALSLFRIIAIAGIGYYIWMELKRGVKTEYLLAIGLIFTGAVGNLIDSMLYDYIFTFDPCNFYNQLKGSENFIQCEHQSPHGGGYTIIHEVRHHGFLLGNVVDMFQFNVSWPQWVPWLGGGQIFPAIWNLADACITCGVGMVLIRNRTYFPKEKN